MRMYILVVAIIGGLMFLGVSSAIESLKATVTNTQTIK